MIGGNKPAIDNKVAVNEKFQSVLKTLAKNLGGNAKENVQNSANQQEVAEENKKNGKDKASSSNPLVPLLDQEKHFFELTKQLMQPSAQTSISIYPLDKLD